MRLALLALVLLTPGCLSAPVERANAALEARVEQIGAEAHRQGAELEERIQRQLDPALRRIDAVEGESARWREESQAWGAESRAWGERTDSALKEARETREVLVAESKAWGQRADRLVATVERLEAAFTGRSEAAPPADRGPSPGSVVAPGETPHTDGSPTIQPPPADTNGYAEWLVWGIGTAGLAVRWWMNRKRARVSLAAAQWCERRAAEESAK